VLNSAQRLIKDAENADSLLLQTNEVSSILWKGRSSTVVIGLPVDSVLPHLFNVLVSSQALLRIADTSCSGCSSCSKSEEPDKQIDMSDLNRLRLAINEVGKTFDSD